MGDTAKDTADVLLERPTDRQLIAEIQEKVTVLEGDLQQMTTKFETQESHYRDLCYKHNNLMQAIENIGSVANSATVQTFW